MSEIKVLFVHHGIGIGGAPTSLLKLILALNPKRYKVKVLFIRDGEVVEQFKSYGIEVEVLNGNSNWFVHNLSGKIHWKYFLNYIGVYRSWNFVAKDEAVKYLKKQSVDIVHLNSHALTSWAYAAKKLNFKVVLHNREAISKGYFGFRYSILKRLIDQHCDAIINISEDNKRRLGLKDRSFVVYNFLQIPSTVKHIPAKGSMLKVAYLGGASIKKGFDTVIKSLPYLNSNVQVFLAGHYPTMQEKKEESNLRKVLRTIYIHARPKRSKKYFDRLHAYPQVKLIGLVDDPLPLIEDCDVLISPFNVPHFSRPAIEAFAYSRPVVATQIDGMSEIVDHNVNGFLVSKGDYNELANVLNRMATNRKWVRQMGIQGRNKAKQLYSQDANIKKVENIYEGILK